MHGHILYWIKVQHVIQEERRPLHFNRCLVAFFSDISLSPFLYNYYKSHVKQSQADKGASPPPTEMAKSFTVCKATWSCIKYKPRGLSRKTFKATSWQTTTLFLSRSHEDHNPVKFNVIKIKYRWERSKIEVWIKKTPEADLTSQAHLVLELLIF